MVNIQIHLLLRGMVLMSSKRSANRKAKEYFGENYGVDWNQPYKVGVHPNHYFTTIEDYYPTY